MFSEKNLTTILDYIRFAFSKANEHKIYFGHGTDNAWDDICSLILGSLYLPDNISSELYHAVLTEDEKNILSINLHKRIIDRVPVPYLINRANFCGLEFYIDERALIPRSPIAELIHNNFSPWIDEDNVHNILDLCTGSGCIAIACCNVFADAMVDASDISDDSLAVARINREKYFLEDRLNLIKSDCFVSIKPKQYDIIVSNPPYVDIIEKASLPLEYHHEPDSALFAPKEGLQIIDEILTNSKKYLSKHGILVVETGNMQEKVIEAYPDVPFVWLDFENGGDGVFLLTRKDLQYL